MTKPIKLPPLPYPQIPGNDYTAKDMQDFATKTAEPYRKVLHDLIRDLEMRSNLKEGRQNGVVDCGNGVYRQALIALGELE